jgi:hypothetical protein
MGGKRMAWALALCACTLLFACDGQDRYGQEAEEVMEAPPGTVPVPGAASPGSAPDPHPAAGATDDAYPGTVEPQRRVDDTLQRPRLESRDRGTAPGRP